jgi:hypothetical protein
LTKLANLFDEQNKIIVSQSIILQELNSKLTVAEGHDSSSLTTPGISLDNYEEKMATVKLRRGAMVRDKTRPKTNRSNGRDKSASNSPLIISYRSISI